MVIQKNITLLFLGIRYHNVCKFLRNNSRKIVYVYTEGRWSQVANVVKCYQLSHHGDKLPVLSHYYLGYAYAERLLIQKEKEIF